MEQPTYKGKYCCSSDFFPYNVPGPLLESSYKGWRAGKLDENITIIIIIITMITRIITVCALETVWKGQTGMGRSVVQTYPTASGKKCGF